MCCHMLTPYSDSFDLLYSRWTTPVPPSETSGLPFALPMSIQNELLSYSFQAHQNNERTIEARIRVLESEGK